ncbi:MAG: ATP-binding protein [Patescibacteria group bacterium]
MTNLAVNVILPSFLGLFLLFSTDTKKNRHAAFTIHVSFAVVFWAFFNFLGLASAVVSGDRETSFILTAISYFGLAFIPPSVISLYSAFLDTFTPTSHNKYRFPFYALAYTTILLLTSDIVLHTNFILSGLKDVGWTKFFVAPGMFFNAFLAYFSTAFTVGTVWLILARKKTTGIIRKQLDYILWPTLIAAVGGTSQFLILYDLPFTIPPVGGFAIPVFVFGLFYAVARFHMFNAKVITAELFTITIWLLLFGKMVFLGNPSQLPLDIGVLILSIIFGLLTIRSVLTEVKQKENLDDANKKLADLNQNLEAKVAAQTADIRTAYEVEKKARIDLETLDKAKDQFILTTQHHLRTPLTVINGFLDSLHTTEKNLTAQGQTSLEKIQHSAAQMSEMVNDFLSMAQHDVGKISFDYAPASVWTLINDIKVDFAEDIKKKKIYFTVDFSDEAKKALVKADKMLRHALFNLVDNAVKYTEEGGVTISGTVKIHPIEKTKILHLEVKDTGIGISSEELPNLFKRYFERGIEAQKINTTGKGIGLVIVKNIIDSHTGRIFASSLGRGKGSTFTVELPAVS